jgi:hypothetical protein
MALEFSICEVRWERCRRVAENPQAREWLKFQAARGLAANTIRSLRTRPRLVSRIPPVSGRFVRICHPSNNRSLRPEHYGCGRS